MYTCLLSVVRTLYVPIFQHPLGFYIAVVHVFCGSLADTADKEGEKNLPSSIFHFCLSNFLSAFVPLYLLSLYVCWIVCLSVCHCLSVSPFVSLFSLQKI